VLSALLAAEAVCETGPTAKHLCLTQYLKPTALPLLLSSYLLLACKAGRAPASGSTATCEAGGTWKISNECFKGEGRGT
jgi:hypothetical protein